MLMRMAVMRAVDAPTKERDHARALMISHEKVNEFSWEAALVTESPEWLHPDAREDAPLRLGASRDEGTGSGILHVL
jgi:hypothetical protein